MSSSRIISLRYDNMSPLLIQVSGNGRFKTPDPLPLPAPSGWYGKSVATYVVKEHPDIDKAYANRGVFLRNLTVEQFTLLYNAELNKVNVYQQEQANKGLIVGSLKNKYYFLDFHLKVKHNEFNCTRKYCCSSIFPISLVIYGVVCLMSIMFLAWGSLAITDYNDTEYYSPTNQTIPINVENDIGLWTLDASASGPPIDGSGPKISYFSYTNAIGMNCEYTTYTNLNADNIPATGNSDYPEGDPVINTLPYCTLFQVSRILAMIGIPFVLINLLFSLWLSITVMSRTEKSNEALQLPSSPSPELKDLLESINAYPSSSQQSNYLYESNKSNESESTKDFSWLLPYSLNLSCITLIIYVISGTCLFIVLNASSFNSYNASAVCMIMILIALPLEIISIIIVKMKNLKRESELRGEIV